MSNTKKQKMDDEVVGNPEKANLFSKIKTIIDSAKSTVAQNVNSLMTAIYYQIAELKVICDGAGERKKAVLEKELCDE